MGFAALNPSYNISLFLLAAVVIAAIPGPGIFYVAARTLSGGRRAGIASTFGTALGGLVHVIAGGIGVSAIILASAQLFTMLKLAGALYLIWLGIRTIREAGHLPTEPTGALGFKRAFREGIVVEALNPKTAAFFLAFIPQFLEPAAGHPALQFMTLGLVSVTFNTFADVIVIVAASAARAGLVRRPHLVRRLRQGSGLFIAGLGISLALARRPATS
jgi:threonine/homoserine/homoserine lactone efflux protein